MRKAGIDFGLTHVKAFWIDDKEERRFLSTAEVSRGSLASVLAHCGVTDLCAAGNGPRDGFGRFATHEGPGDPLTLEIRTQAEGARRLLEAAGRPAPDRHHVVSVGTGVSYALREADGALVTLLGSPFGAGAVDGILAFAGIASGPQIDVLLADAPDGASFDLTLGEAVPSLRGTPYASYVAAHFAKAARGAEDDRDAAKRLFASSAVNALVVDVARSLLLHDRNPACRLVPDSAVAPVVVLGTLPARSRVVRRRLEAALRMIGKEPLFPDRGEYALAVGIHGLIGLEP